MSESQGIPRTRVSLAQGKLGLLVYRAFAPDRNRLNLREPEHAQNRERIFLKMQQSSSLAVPKPWVRVVSLVASLSDNRPIISMYPRNFKSRHRELLHLVCVQ